MLYNLLQYALWCLSDLQYSNLTDFIREASVRRSDLITCILNRADKTMIERSGWGMGGVIFLDSDLITSVNFQAKKLYKYVR